MKEDEDPRKRMELFKEPWLPTTSKTCLPL